MKKILLFLWHTVEGIFMTIIGGICLIMAGAIAIIGSLVFGLLYGVDCVTRLNSEEKHSDNIYEDPYEVDPQEYGGGNTPLRPEQ